MALTWRSSGREEVEAERLDQLQHAFGGGGIEKPCAPGIDYVERHADGDGFPVPDLEIGDLLELMRGPVTEIERARGAHLERISGCGNVFNVQLGTAEDETLHGLGLETGERGRMVLEPVEKVRVADACDLHRLDVAGAFVTRGE